MTVIEINNDYFEGTIIVSKGSDTTHASFHNITVNEEMLEIEMNTLFLTDAHKLQVMNVLKTIKRSVISYPNAKTASIHIFLSLGLASIIDGIDLSPDLTSLVNDFNSYTISTEIAIGEDGAYNLITTSDSILNLDMSDILVLAKFKTQNELDAESFIISSQVSTVFNAKTIAHFATFLSKSITHTNIIDHMYALYHKMQKL